jgi:hypothetical protein
MIGVHKVALLANFVAKQDMGLYVVIVLCFSL